MARQFILAGKDQSGPYTLPQVGLDDLHYMLKWGAEFRRYPDGGFAVVANGPQYLGYKAEEMLDRLHASFSPPSGDTDDLPAPVAGALERVQEALYHLMEACDPVTANKPEPF